MGRKIVVLVAVLIATTIAYRLVSSSTSSSPLQISGVTVTATAKGEASVVSLQLRNRTSSPVVILSVSSPSTRTSMLEYDADMCRGGTIVSPLPNIEIGAHQEMRWTTSGVGAMLMRSRGNLRPGDVVTLRVVSQVGLDTHTRTESVSATVVPQPRGLQTSVMRMSAPRQ